MLTRSQDNPILKPNKNHSWESRKVYNCGVIYDNNQYHLFYRAVSDDWISSIGYAVSKNGENFQCNSKPILFPENELEKRGLEDPRVTKVDDIYYLTFTAYDGITARLNLATSKDLKIWKRHGAVLPSWDLTKAKGFLVDWDEARNNPKTEKDWSKAGGIFSEVIKNNYWMLFGDSNIWLANSQDGVNWQPVWEPFIRPRKNDHFDNVHIEMGAPPIKTDKGWLVLYHGIDDKIVYRLGFLILDLNNPTKILYRSQKPIFEPIEPYELSGVVDILPGGLKAMEKMDKRELKDFIKKAEEKNRMPKVTFCCGAVVVNDILRIYYGASDSVICTATAKLDNILDIYKNNL